LLIATRRNRGADVIDQAETASADRTDPREKPRLDERAVGRGMQKDTTRLFSAAGGVAPFVSSSRHTNHQFCIQQLIGHAAECRLGYGGAYTEADVRRFLDQMKELLAEEEDVDSGLFDGNDEYSALRMIQDTSPGATIEDIVEYFLFFQEMAIQAANEHWTAIERVARALLDKIPSSHELFRPFPRGRVWLTHNEVKKLSTR
jgi:hypothetical protein